MTELCPVSVIIPTFQRFDDVQNAIDSVLKQSIGKYVEILVVNDNSPDWRYSTLQEKYKNSNHSLVKVINLPINSRILTGEPSAQGIPKNKGIEHARGDWIAFLDDDDAYVDPYKLEKQISYMILYNQGMSSTNMFKGTETYNPNINLTETYFPTYFNPGEELVENSLYKLSKNDIERDNLINNSTVVIHKNLFGMLPENFRVCQYEDWDMWKRVLNYTNCLYLTEPTVYYKMNNLKYYE